MAHRGYGGHKAKPQKKAKHARHFDKCKKNKRKIVDKWNRNREKWANDKKYQEKKIQRQQKIDELRHKYNTDPVFKAKMIGEKNIRKREKREQKRKTS